MADRFYSEGSKNNGAAGSDSGASSPKPSATNPYSSKPTRGLGDFSENIDSNKVKSTSGYQPSQKKFEVHINDFDSFVGMPEPPSATKPPRPIEQRKRPVGGAQRVPAQSVNKPETGKKFNPIKRPAPSVGGAKRVEPTQKAASTRPAGAPTRPAATGRSVAQTQQRVPGANQPRPQQRANTQGKQPSKAQSERMKAKKRYNFVKAALISCVCVFFITILTVTASTIAMETINDILVIDKGANRSVSVTIPEGAEFNDVFNILEDKGLVKQKTLCYLFLLFREYNTVEYVPGIYYLQASDGIEANIETIMAKKSGSKDTVRLTFPEGWTVAQIFEKIEKYEVCTAEELYANLDNIASQYSFINDITSLSGRYLKAEGYLFPDTYDFYIDESPSSVLKKLLANFENRWTQEYTDQMNKLGMTMDEIINIAAMIQREAKDTKQMTVISSIIHNRLEKPATFPTLEMNSTKDYISSLKDYKLFSEFYYELYLSTYNTYSAQGLPPGPICNPGSAAIRAALFPDDTNYYFFMHSPTGEIYLAQTADEHQANTDKFLYG